METLWQDLRYGARMLRRPGSDAGRCHALMLGIGANTALSGWSTQCCFVRLPYADAERLAIVWEHRKATITRRMFINLANFLDGKSRTVF